MTTTNTTTNPAAAITLALVAAATIGVASTSAFADTLTHEVAILVDDNVIAGEWGFLLKEANGPVLADVNPDYLFYPASTMKIVQHVHALKMIEENNGIDLETSVNVYNQADSCDDDHAGQNATQHSMENTLLAMMVGSQAPATNAIQDYFGRVDINATVHGVGGMSNATQLNHKFGAGCGGPQQDQNQLPLNDAATLFERIANGQVFDLDQTREQFYDQMPQGYFSDLLDEERPEHLSDAAFDQFKAGIREAYTGGSWGENTHSALGWVKFPAPPCEGGAPREFTYGAFFDDANSIQEGFTPQTVVYAMLRVEVRELLLEWFDCTVCGSGGSCVQVSETPGCNQSDCCNTVCMADPWCCDLGWDPGCVIQAIELCGLGPQIDDCADAKPILDGLSAGVFEEATNDGPGHEGLCGWDTQFVKDVWFSYTATIDGHLEIRSLAEFPTWIAVYDTTQCPVSENDLLACVELPGDAVDEVIETCAYAGLTYLIRVGAGNPEVGDVTLYVDNEVGFANDGYEDNANGLGLANQIIADDFMLPECDTSWLDRLNLKVVNQNGDGLPSSLQWFLYEGNAAGDGPGLQIGTGVATDLHVTPIDGGTAGAPESFFDLEFTLESMPELVSGTTYWFGFMAGGVLPLPADAPSGHPAHSFALGSWLPQGGDFAFALGPQDTPGTCPTDVDGNGETDIDDLVAVILEFGTAGTAGNTDIDGNGTVDVDDVVAVILNWGACP